MPINRNGTQADTSELETILQQVGVKARSSASWSAVSSKVGSETHISITLADVPSPAPEVVKEAEEPAPAAAQ